MRQRRRQRHPNPRVLVRVRRRERQTQALDALRLAAAPGVRIEASLRRTRRRPSRARSRKRLQKKAVGAATALTSPVLLPGDGGECNARTRLERQSSSWRHEVQRGPTLVATHAAETARAATTRSNLCAYALASQCELVDERTDRSGRVVARIHQESRVFCTVRERRRDAGDVQQALRFA